MINAPFYPHFVFTEVNKNRAGFRNHPFSQQGVELEIKITDCQLICLFLSHSYSRFGNCVFGDYNLAVFTKFNFKKVFIFIYSSNYIRFQERSPQSIFKIHHRFLNFRLRLRPYSNSSKSYLCNFLVMHFCLNFFKDQA